MRRGEYCNRGAALWSPNPAWGGWFFRLKKPALWFLSRSFKSIFSHPITLQFPASMIKAELEKKTRKVKVTEIPKGKFVLQFGFKVPSFLTPAVPFAFDAIKE